MFQRLCIDCRKPCTKTRCVECERAKQRRKPAYSATWRKVSKQARAETPYCAVCGCTTDLTADHVVPRSKGGTDDLWNARVLCRSHNSSKGNRGNKWDGTPPLPFTLS